MLISPVRRLAVATLLALLACSLAGCWNPFAPNENDGGGGGQADYRIRTTHENIIHNIETAYEYRNAVEYLDCLSEDFVFYPSDRDVQDPELNIPPEWFKTDETSMHNNMFDDSSDVESISLTLTVIDTTSFQNEPGNPDDDEWVYEVGVDLRVNVMGGLTYLATTPSEYHFRRDGDQTGPNGEELREIFKWYDLDERGGRTNDDPNVRIVSLAEMKSLFFD